MTLDDVVMNCPQDQETRNTIRRMIEDIEKQGGPLIVRYYRYDSSTHLLHDETLHHVLPVPQ